LGVHLTGGYFLVEDRVGDGQLMQGGECRGGSQTSMQKVEVACPTHFESLAKMMH